jgi:hypothetical protein
MMKAKNGIINVLNRFFTNVLIVYLPERKKYPLRKKNNGMWKEYIHFRNSNGKVVWPITTRKMPIPFEISTQSNLFWMVLSIL